MKLAEFTRDDAGEQLNWVLTELRAAHTSNKPARNRRLRLACFDIELFEKRLLFNATSPAITPPGPALGYQNDPAVFSASAGNTSFGTAFGSNPGVTHAASATPNPVTGTS